MRSHHQQRIDKFMRLAKQEVPNAPLENPSAALRILRAKLIYEECMETLYNGLGVVVRPPRDPDKDMSQEFVIVSDFDMVETIDGCCDISVVTTGTLSALGIPDLPFLEEVDNNNLAKFGPGGYRAGDPCPDCKHLGPNVLVQCTRCGGSRILPGPAGKWIKPPGHEPPRIQKILEALKNKWEFVTEEEKGPVAWYYELSSYIDRSKPVAEQRSGWRKHLGFNPPNAGDGQRNVTPLYAHPSELQELDYQNAGANALAEQLLNDDGSGVMSPGPCADVQMEWRRLKEIEVKAAKEKGGL